MIEMTVAGVRIEFPSNSPIVLLREAEGERWTAGSEITPRPMTHDLLKNILDEMSVQVTSITITELRDGVFHATIGLQRNGSSFEISSRPSDAIALAVRLGCKIFANEDVLEEASILIPADGEEEEKQLQEFREFLENVAPEDFE
jgi:bifunctional DNase/RNase